MSDDSRVVITGIGIVCSLGRGKAAVLQGMKLGEPGIALLSSIPTEGFGSHVGAELPKILRQEITRNDMDLCAAFAVTAVADALLDARLPRIDCAKAGLVLGTCNGGLISLEEQGSVLASDLDRNKTARYPFYRQADDVARAHNIGGPVITINTACAASGNAVGLGFDLIQGKKAEVVLAGGSDAMSYAVYAGFNSLQALKAQPCSPFAEGPGLSLGEGAAFLVLERMSTAVSRGARIYAEVLGYGLSNDGHHATAPDPQGAGVARAITSGLRHAQVVACDVDYVNAHGTGTAANDKAELKGVEAAFVSAPSVPLLSSSKAYFGHNLGAAAAIELATTLICQEEGLVPATINQGPPREGCDKDYIVRRTMQSKRLDTFISNNMAFGGHNCSLVLGREGAPRAQPRQKRDVICRILAVGMVGARGMGTSISEIVNGPNTGSYDADYNLKEHVPNVFERRMNKMSQLTLGSVSLCLDAADLPIDDLAEQVGVIFGTALGSLDCTSRFVQPILTSGAAGASSVLFPDLVLNSTAGKIARLLGIRGFSTSLSTGGNDGLAAAFYGFLALRAGYARHVLVSAADERSDLEGAINEAECIGFHTTDSAVTVALTAGIEGVPLLDFELGFNPVDEERSKLAGDLVLRLMSSSRLEVNDISFVLYTSPSPARGVALTTEMHRKLENVACVSFDAASGYSRASSSLMHLGLASELLQSDIKLRRDLVPGARLGAYGIVLAEAINGGLAATLLGGEG